MHQPIRQALVHSESAHVQPLGGGNLSGVIQLIPLELLSVIWNSDLASAPATHTRNSTADSIACQPAALLMLAAAENAVLSSAEGRPHRGETLLLLG